MYAIRSYYGAIIVDEYMYSSDPNVLAIGDCASIYSNAINDTAYIALATNAVRIVITSYSIHYTKLYELIPRVIDAFPVHSDCCGGTALLDGLEFAHDPLIVADLRFGHRVGAPHRGDLLGMDHGAADVTEAGGKRGVADQVV